tara:strand:+ start:3781 stop:4062 length:282 start_codon:yes stop_codon:yes gene_type:complete
MYEDRKFVIIPASGIESIDFSEVLETAADTCRYSVDGTKTFIKYGGSQPPSVVAITGKSQEYTYTEILDIISGVEWASEPEEFPGSQPEAPLV